MLCEACCLLVFVSNTQEHGKTVEGREIEQNLMRFSYTLYTQGNYDWQRERVVYVGSDHATALLLTHKLNMEDKHTKSLKSMKIFFTEKFFHARVMEKQSTARIINFHHQIYRI